MVDLVSRFEAQRGELEAIAYRMLGSASEADDAVQEAWLRLQRAGEAGIQDLRAWLKTVVSRIALDMLRARTARREDSFDAEPTGYAALQAAVHDPEQEVVRADALGLAMQVVLDRLAPAERVAFVLHDMFDLPFDEIAPIVDRTPTAARQLASRARRRVQGTQGVPAADLARQRTVVEAYLAASRGGDFDGLLAVLDPGVVLRVDAAASPTGAAREIRGAAVVARNALAGAKGAAASEVALVGGALGLLVVPRGRLAVALVFTTAGDKVVGIEAIADPTRLRALELSALDFHIK